jgi:hypothetical protein
VVFILGMYVVETTTFVKIRVNHGKKSSKFTQKIAHVDDMMIHNLVNILSKPEFVVQILTNHVDSFLVWNL